jgi:lipopolysaccharide export system permease protein
MATFALYHSLIPYTHLLLRTMVLKDVETLLYSYLKRDGEFKQPKLSYSIFVRKVEGHKLINVIFKQRDANGEPHVVISAHEAELQVDMVNKKVRVFMRNGEVCDPSRTTFAFRDQMEEVSLPDSLGGAYEARPSDLTWAEIKEKQKETQAKIDETLAAMAAAEAGNLPNHARENWPRHRKDLYYLHAFLSSTLFQLNAELQMRPALAAGCFFFVLIGCPVGIWFSRSDYLSAFMTCFLPIVFLYYPLLLCGTNLGKEGRYIPELCIWAADGVMGLFGLLFYWRLLRN